LKPIAELNLISERFADLRNGIDRRVDLAVIVNDAKFFASVSISTDALARRWRKY
jgi:hypothetical protein